MYTELIIYGICIWLLSGVRGFFHYRLKQYTFTKSEISTLVLSAIRGPISWILWYQAMKEKSIFANRQNKKHNAQCDCEFCKRGRM